MFSGRTLAVGPRIGIGVSPERAPSEGTQEQHSHITDSTHTEHYDYSISISIILTKPISLPRWLCIFPGGGRSCAAVYHYTSL